MKLGLAAKVAGLFGLLSLSSCATYTISNGRLAEQMAGAVPKEGTYTYVSPAGGAVGGAVGALFLFNHSMNNGITSLAVQDENGKDVTIHPDMRTQIRLHKKDGDYSTFYFDTMFMKDSCWIGDRTHFFPSAIKPIPFAEISKIEIQ